MMTSSLFKRYFIAFNQYKWLSLISFLMVMAASGTVALNTKNSPNYVAKGTLIYNGSSAPSTNNSQIRQQQQILSKDILVSNELIENVEKDTKLSADLIRDNLDVNLPEKTETGELKTSVITVKYKDTEPQRAKNTLLAVMRRMEQQSYEHNIYLIQSIKKSIQRKLNDGEEIVGNYDILQNSESIEAEKNRLHKAIEENKNQQDQIQQKLSSIDTQTRGASYSRAFIVSIFSEDESITKLNEQINQTESKLAQLESIFLPTHPNVINLREQLTSDKKRLQTLAADAVRSLRLRMDDLKQSKEKLEQQHKSAFYKQQMRSPLEQQVQRKKAIREQLDAKLKEAEVQEAQTISSLDAQERIFVDLEQEFFSRSIPAILGMGAVVGVLVGGGLIVLLSLLQGKFQTWEEIEASLEEKQIQLLGVLPLLKSAADSQILPVLSSNSDYIEFYEQYYEQCLNNLRSFGGTLKVVLLSSTVHFEGKTITAYNLGIVSARAGKKTLIVETDLRSPSQCKSLGVTPPENVVQPLRYYDNPNCIQSVPNIENLSILPSPGSMQQTTEILKSEEINLLLKSARSNFDLVILDTPALGFSNDALLLEPYSDGIVLVTRPQYTQKKLLAEAIAQLTDLELRLLGVIINGVDIPLPDSEVAQYRETPSGIATKNEEAPARTKYL